MTARSWPWDLPSPRARTPPGAIPTRLARAVRSPWASSFERRLETRAPMSLAFHAASRVKRVGVASFELGRACPRGGLVAPAGVATGDASDRRLHFETVSNSSTRASSLPSAATGARAMPFGARPGVALVPEPHGSVLVRARCLFSRPTSHVRKRVRCTPEGSGPPDANEAGEIRVSRRGSHFGAREGLFREALSSSERARTRPPLTSLSPPPSRWRGLAFRRAPSVGPEAAKTGSAGAS